MPRYDQERVARLSGGKHRCLACGAEWPAARLFFKEFNARLRGEAEQEAQARPGEAGADTETEADRVAFKLKSDFVQLVSRLNRKEVALLGELVDAPRRAPGDNYGYRDVAEAAGRPPASFAERVDLWKQWFRDRQSTVSLRPSQDDPRY